jgi:hypothetical protein
MNKTTLLSPLLVAVAPVWFLWANNAGQITLGEALGWTAVSLAGAAGLVALATRLFHQPAAAALVVSAAVSLFYLYGHAFEALWNLGIAPRQRYIHAALLTACTALLAGIAYGVRRRAAGLERLSTCVGIAAGVMLLFSSISLATHAMALWKSAPRTAAPGRESRLAAHPHGASPNMPVSAQPDIYYIILDGYARADVLTEHYGFDNREFLDYLRGRGFYIAEQSCTNYPYTHLSLASSLNLRYHDEREVHNPSEIYFYHMIQRPLAAEVLQARGYRYVHFSTNWAGTQCSQLADLDLNRAPNPLVGNLAVCLRQTTMARLWDGVHRNDFSQANSSTLENLPRVAELPGPTFALAHIIAPHPPYQYDRQGRRRDDLDQASRESYVGQLVYVNRRVQAALEQILARSATPPIIVLQADHGAGFFSMKPVNTFDNEEEYFRERLPILNAYLVPDAVRERLYPTISPVNTFRLLFSECFDADYPLLAERHYVGFRARPEVVDVTHRIDRGQPTYLATPPTRSKLR